MLRYWVKFENGINVALISTNHNLPPSDLNDQVCANRCIPLNPRITRDHVSIKYLAGGNSRAALI